MAAFKRVDSPRRRIPVDEERADARAKKVIGAARAEAAQRAGPARAGKRERFVGVGEMRDDAPVRRYGPAQRRQNLRGHVAPVVERFVRKAAERRAACAGAMLVDELAHLIDGADAVEVALALRGAPGKEPMAAEDQSICARVVPDRRFDEERELEPGPLPGHPDDAPAEPAIEFLELLFAVCRSRPARWPSRDADDRRGARGETHAAAYRSTRRPGYGRMRRAGSNPPSRLRTLRRDSAISAVPACRDRAARTPRR